MISNKDKISFIIREVLGNKYIKEELKDINISDNKYSKIIESLFLNFDFIYNIVLELNGADTGIKIVNGGDVLKAIEKFVNDDKVKFTKIKTRNKYSIMSKQRQCDFMNISINVITLEKEDLKNRALFEGIYGK